MSEPKPARNEPAIRVVMMPRDTNGQGTIFGGVILSYIDQAAFVEARRQACHSYVTIKMDEVIFHEPVFVGDVLAFYAHATKIGRTSMEIRIEVIAERCDQPEKQVPVTRATVVFVAVDDHRKPTPIAI